MEFIEMRPDICGGRPVIKGTRLEVRFIVDMIESGMSIEEILSEYSFLSRDILEKIKENIREIKKLIDAAECFEIDPNRMAGVPVVKGTRLPVIVIYDMLDLGYTINDILSEYPFLTREIVEKLIKYRSIIEPFVRKVTESIPFQR